MGLLVLDGRDERQRGGFLIAAGIAAVVWLSRWPFLGPGFGDDADAWRVAEAARQMSAAGVFHSSRVPGHPVSDAVMGWLYPLGPVAITGTTALLSALAVLFFYQWLLLVKARRPLSCAAALAFMPAFYVSSTTALDFVWAFAFLMAALVAVMHRRAVGAGLLLSLAIGCRNTAGAFLVPLGILLFSRPGQKHPVRDTLLLALVSVGSGALAYLPVYLTEGLPYLLFYWEDPYPAWPIRLMFSLYELTGLIGGLVLLILLAQRLTRKRLHTPAPPTVDRSVIVAAGAGILLYTTAFLVLPHEGIYMLPAVPFILYLADRYVFSTKTMRIMAAALFVSSMLLSIEPVKHPDDPSESPSLFFRLMGFKLAWHWSGPVPAGKIARQEGLAYADRILAVLQGEPPPVALAAGRWQPILLNRLAEQHPQVPQTEIAIRYLLDREELNHYQDHGYRLFMLPYQNIRNIAMYGIDLTQENVRLLLDP